MSLQSHKTWAPTEKLWYNKYHSRIELGPYPRYGQVKFVPKHDQFRERQRNVKHGILTTVYTSDTELIEGLVKDYAKVKSIHTPINQEHADILLDPSRDINVRDTLFFKKYRIKMYISRNWNKPYDNDKWNIMSSSLIEWMQDTFKDTKYRSQIGSSLSYNFYNIYFNRYVHVPFVYTNDEQGIMMMKLQFGDDFRYYMTYAYTPQDFSPA